MNQSRQYVLRKSLVLLLGEAVVVGLMCGVYALLDKFHVGVLLGGMVGALVAVGNFLALAIVATLAADRAEQQDVAGGQKLIRGSYPMRLLAMAAILFVCAGSGFFDVVALALPLLFVRPILTLTEFFSKKEA